MKCKRLCAWLLSLVMMFSLLPVSAAAVKWYDEHSVTVKYVFKDDSSKSKSDDVKKTIPGLIGEIITFKVEKAGYKHSAQVTSGKADCSIDDLGYLHVEHVDADSVITVTYTPKDNYIYIDKYFGGAFSHWNKENIKLNGYEFVENNALPKKYVIENHKLAPAMEKYRFLTVTNADNSTTVYDFSYAVVIPKTSESTSVKIKDVWYDRDAGEWYYSYDDPLGLFDKIPLVNVGGVNFCYNTPHSQSSKYHDFVATTVDPTCTEQGYTVYKCKYCGMTKWDDFKKPLDHDWGTYVHVEGMDKEVSQHQRVCQREGCNATSTPEGCNFVDTSIETGTKHTCTVCGYSYTDEITPTGTPVYVYFKTVHSKDGNVRVNDGDGVTYNNNTGGWATLGKLTTEQTVAVSTDKTVVGNLGAEVNKTNPKFVKHQDNENFDLDLISEWVELKKDNGAAGYGDAPTWAWHLNGKVNVYKLSYDANPPDGVAEEAVTGMPGPAYYLPDREAPVSTDDPTLQGYNFEGWYKEPECVTEAKGTVAVTEDTDLYAKWTPAQPTTDFGSVAITTTKPELKETVDLSGGAYEVPYTATYTMSDKLLRMLKAAPSGVPMTFVVELDSRLTAKKDPATDKFLYDFDGAGILEVDKSSITVSGNKITVLCNPVTDWANAVKDKTSVVMTLKGTGVLAATNFAAGKYLNTTGHIKGTIPVGGTPLPIVIPANACQTKMTAQTYTVTYDANGGSGTMTDKNSPYAYKAVATVLTNGFTRSKYTFTGWNTKADGSGDSYKTGDKIPMTDNVVLYAQWTRNSSHDDDDDKYFFAIQKVDAQDDHALNGAKFELYQRDRRDNKLPASRKTTSHWGTESGIALFSVSATKTSNGGSTWYYREITAPEGYVLDSTEHKIKAANFSGSRSTAVSNAVTVRNYRGTTPDLLNDSDHFAYVIGYMDGNVRPYGLISRAETTTIFFRLLKDSVRDGNLLTSNTYTDVADDYWANTAISTMTGLGIVQGRSTTTFDPKAPITRAQFAAICARFDTGKSSGEQTFSDIQGHWAEKYIERAAELGWIKGFEDGTFRPDTYITRAQAMTMINRVLNRIPEDESDLLPGMNVWPDCNPGDWFYLAVQEATNSHDFEHKAGNYETWTGMNKDPDWTRYEN